MNITAVLVYFFFWIICGFIGGFRFAQWFFRKYPENLNVTDEQVLDNFHNHILQYLRKLKAKIFYSN